MAGRNFGIVILLLSVGARLQAGDQPRGCSGTRGRRNRPATGKNAANVPSSHALPPSGRQRDFPASTGSSR